MYIHIQIYLQIYTYVNMYICIYIYIYIHMYIYIYICVWVNLHIYTDIHSCIWEGRYGGREGEIAWRVQFGNGSICQVLWQPGKSSREEAIGGRRVQQFGAVPDSGTMQRLGAMVRSWNVARLGARLDWWIPCGCCPRCLPRATDSSPSRCSLAEYALGGLPA